VDDSKIIEWKILLLVITLACFLTEFVNAMIWFFRPGYPKIRIFF
jgi:hypothetical protein